MNEGTRVEELFELLPTGKRKAWVSVAGRSVLLVRSKNSRILDDLYLERLRRTSVISTLLPAEIKYEPDLGFVVVGGSSGTRCTPDRSLLRDAIAEARLRESDLLSALCVAEYQTIIGGRIDTASLDTLVDRRAMYSAVHLEELEMSSQVDSLRREMASAFPSGDHDRLWALVNYPSRTTPSELEIIHAYRRIERGKLTSLGIEGLDYIFCECLRSTNFDFPERGDNDHEVDRSIFHRDVPSRRMDRSSLRAILGRSGVSAEALEAFDFLGEAATNNELNRILRGRTHFVLYCNLVANGLDPKASSLSDLRAAVD